MVKRVCDDSGNTSRIEKDLVKPDTSLSDDIQWEAQTGALTYSPIEHL